jgi:hypothetical protein
VFASSKAPVVRRCSAIRNATTAAGTADADWFLRKSRLQETSRSHTAASAPSPPGKRRR